jgi:alpha-tubulin suppressor-like RCC1 family protein
MTRRTLEVRLRGASLALCLAGAVFSGISCRDDNSVGPTDPGAPEPGQALAITTAAALAFRQMSAGFFHTCGVTTDDRAYCWGWNKYGQLGDGTTIHRTRPVLVAGGHLFREISAGDTRTCGVTTDNRAYCWGYNANGQLGDGTAIDRLTPVPVTGGLRFRQINVNRYQGGHTCGVTTEDRAYCWGTNFYGQLGDGTTVYRRRTPVPVVGTLLFREVTVGYFYTCGVTTERRAHCWGYNGQGQLGDGTTTNRKRPVMVAGGFLFRQVSAGSSHACGATTEYRAYCWGDGHAGKLGDGSGLDKPTPFPVSGGLSFRQVNAGAFHSCGVTRDNRAYCWGDNAYGALGDGTKRNWRSTPGAVAGGLDFSSVSAGDLHTCGRTPSAAGYCWGWNGFGQLGDFTRTNRLTPRAVVGPM